MPDYTFILDKILTAIGLIGGGGGGGSSSITSNTSIEYGAGNVTAKTQRVAIASDAISTLSKAQISFTENQLTEPDTTTSRSMTGYTMAFIQVVIAAIDTNVVIRIEGSNDNTNWSNLSALNADTTITANGVYGFTFTGCPAFIRTNFVSESGGTAATVDVITRLSA